MCHITGVDMFMDSQMGLAVGGLWKAVNDHSMCVQFAQIADRPHIEDARQVCGGICLVIN